MSLTAAGLTLLIIGILTVALTTLDGLGWLAIIIGGLLTLVGVTRRA